MTQNPNIERAAKVLGECLPILRDHANHSLEHSSTALATAGLLVTPLHERALEACEAMAKYYTHNFRNMSDHPIGAACKVGRESLALKEKAKGASEPRYVTLSLTNGSMLVMLADAPVGSRVVYSGTEQQARRVAAALNEGDES